MENLDKLTEAIRNEEEIHISSILTKAWTIGGIISIALTDLAFWGLRKNIDFDVFVLILILLVLNGLVLLRFIYASEASLKGKNLTLKKLFRDKVEIDVNSILKIDSVDLGSSKGAVVKYSHYNNSSTAVIFTSNSLIFGKDIAAAEILQTAQELREEVDN